MINDFRGDLTDISAKTATLVKCPSIHRAWIWTSTRTPLTFTFITLTIYLLIVEAQIPSYPGSLHMEFPYGAKRGRGFSVRTGWYCVNCLSACLIGASASLSWCLREGTASLTQALCFTHRVPARRVAPVAPVRGQFWWCGGLVSSESWAL